MENKHKHYLKFFETKDEYNNQKYLDVDDPNYIMGDPHVVMIGNDGDMKNIIFFDSTRFSRNYFTIEALENMTVKFSKNTLEYRIIGQNNRWDILSSNKSIYLESNQKVQFKMICPISNSNSIGTFTISGSCNIEGNIMSLLYGDDFVGKTDLTGKNLIFFELFKNCTKIKNAKNLVIPATTLANSCYNSMFYGCTSLVTAPELPATTLADSCYSAMFYGCASLVNVPKELPSTILTNKCYEYMFYGCGSLETAPELPATTLADSCYRYMFYDCISLVTAPKELPATTFANSCCAFMFQGCRSLVSAPELKNATTLSDYCCQNMFYGCTSLVTAPELPATTLADSCYINMFRSCKSLVNAPEVLPAKRLTNYCYEYMFSGCTSLESAPKLKNATILANSCYAYMFSGCTKLKTTPEFPIATTLADSCCSYMFKGCTSLESFVEDTPVLPATTLASYCYYYMFEGCTSLKKVSLDLTYRRFFDHCFHGMFSGCTSLDLEINSKIYTSTLADYCCCDMFAGCASLVTAPELQTETLAYSCYSGMFYGCISLVNAPALPAKTLAHSCYGSMFQSCTSLVNAPELPAETLAQYCYRQMFGSCTSLETAPALPATTLESNCYQYMFDGCKKLVDAPALPAKTLADYCYFSMFYNCSSLVNAPALPAETLAKSCYGCMFSGCASLVSAPELPATILVDSCYSNMFYACSKLNYIKMLATDISATSCLNYWVSGVANIGIFNKNVSLTSIKRGKNGIPNDWSVYVDCVSPSFINKSNSNVNLYHKSGIYTPSSSNINLSGIYTNDELLSMRPECDLYVDVVYRYKENNIGEIIKENYLWDNSKDLDDILNELNLKQDYNYMSRFVIVIVDMIEPEESGYYYSDDNLYEYFTIEALEDDLTVSLKDTQNTSYYRIDNGSWTSLSAGLTTHSINTGQKMQFKMTDPTISTTSGIGTFTISGSCNIEGNIMSLLYGDDFVDKTDLTGKNYAFRNLFFNCKTIKNAINLVLPATTLARECYLSMFYGCASLETAPELPATTLARDCYYSMFNSCTSLIIVPALPATTLASYCYYNMFRSCRSLVIVPELPATTLETCCYQYMFDGCTSLKTAPELPATTLASYCYADMFRGCKSLVIAPELPAKTLADYCYFSMFYNCSSLVNAPALPAETLAKSCYGCMFSGCASLVSAPELPATILVDSCYSNMFYACSKLNYIKMLATDISASDCLYKWVYGVANIGMFNKNITLTSIRRNENGIPNDWSVYVDCVSPSFINTLNTNVNLYHKNGIYTPSSSNIDLSGKYATDELLSMRPECDLYVDIVYNYGIIKENYLWDNSKDLDDILNELNLKQDYNYMSRFVIVIVDMIEPEESGYYYSDDNLYEYFTIEALEDDLTVSLKDTQNTSYYRINNGTWKSLSAGSTIPEINAGQKIQFKMTDPTISTKSPYGIGTFNINKSCNIEGNIMSLLYGDDFIGKTDLTGKNYAFYNLFYNCTKIKNAKNLVLPATTLADSCYSSMFQGCTSLETTPELPATTLSKSCYIAMFYDCTSLETTPELPATTLADYCYSSMFKGCISLKTAPELPATTLSTSCYSNMFEGCISLENTQEALPATTLADYCYSSMFSGCNSLVNVPKELPATTLKTYCYSSMFNGCNFLGNGPALPATTLASGCYSSMFKGCISLKTAPELQSTTLADSCYHSMFFGCTSLKTAPTLQATTLTDYCYEYMFYDCKNLNRINMLATDISASDCLYKWVYGVANSGIFNKNVSLTSIQRNDSGIPNGWTIYVDCVSPSFINKSNSNVNLYYKNGIYTPKSSNIDLSGIYATDELLSMRPECDLYIDIVYNYGIIKENYLWDNSKDLDDILNELNLKQDYNYMSKIAIIIVDMIEPEESGYYYDKYSS